MQLFLDILGDLAFYYFDMLQNPDRPVAVEYKWHRFIRHGVLHASCLGDYRNRYINGVFEPKDALEMLVELSILIDLGSKEEYLMPCLLDGEEFEYTGPEPKTQALPPMAIEFPNGGPILGTYYNLVSRVSDQWGQIMNRLGDPYNLARNCMYFRVIENLPGMVCLSDPLSGFLLITYHCDADMAAEVCPKIRKGLLDLIEDAYVDLGGYSSSQGRAPRCQPKATFLCPCKTAPIHPAVLSSAQSYLTCPYGLPGFEAVTPEQMQWLKG